MGGLVYVPLCVGITPVLQDLPRREEAADDMRFVKQAGHVALRALAELVHQPGGELEEGDLFIFHPVDPVGRVGQRLAPPGESI